MDKPKVKCLGANKKFMEFLRETKSVNKAMKMLEEWDVAHNIEIGCVCTDNEYEAELEREWIKDRKRVYAKKKKSSKKKK